MYDHLVSEVTKGDSGKSLPVKLLAFFLSSLAVLPGPTNQGVPTSKWVERRKLYPELMSTFDLANAAPALLRALALLRIASSPELKDNDWKRDLLEESFEVAEQSTVPWPVDYVSPQGPTQVLSRRARRSNELNSGLDRLSLQTAAVHSMLAVDKQRARSLFNSIPRLELLPLACSDGLVPKVESYYETAGQLAKVGFSSQKKGKQERVDFLLMVILSISSPIEVGPAAQMLLDQKLPSEESRFVVASFAEKLNKLAGDSRSFFDNLDSTTEMVLRLSNSVDGKDAEAFLRAWRSYFVTNLRGVRCAETVEPKWTAKSVDAFNLRATRSESLPPILQDDIRPQKVDSPLPDDPMILTPLEQDFDKRWWALMFGGQGKALSDEEKSTAEWKANFDEFVNAIENLEASGLSGNDLIWKKCELMQMAALSAPAGPDRDHALNRYVELLKIANLSSQILPEWLDAVETAIELMQSLYHDREQVLKALENGGDPLLTLVAKIYRLGPPPSAAGERFVGNSRVTSF